MKYINILSAISLTDIYNKPIVDEENNQIKLTFNQFVLGRLSDPKFSKNMNMVMSALQIKQALDKSDGNVLALETSDWTNLVDVVRDPSPTAPYHPLYAINLVPFMKEVVNATDVEPTDNN